MELLKLILYVRVEDSTCAVLQRGSGESRHMTHLQEQWCRQDFVRGGGSNSHAAEGGNRHVVASLGVCGGMPPNKKFIFWM